MSRDLSAQSIQFEFRDKYLESRGNVGEPKLSIENLV